jgi:hypothetical protein
MAFNVVTVDKVVLSTAGGELVTVIGTFPRDTMMTVHLGPLVSGEDPACYGGEGYGYQVFSLDGTTFTFTTPPMEKGQVGLTVVWSVWSETLGFLLSVVERNWPGKVFDVRKSFPPWAGVGNRRLELEDLE